MTTRNCNIIPNAWSVLINERFASYLRERRLAPRTIEDMLWALRYAARFLIGKRRGLDSLHSEQLAEFLSESIPSHWHSYSKKHYITGLHHWFSFREPGFSASRSGKIQQQMACPWYHWVSDYLYFLQFHRGLSPSSCRSHRDVVSSYLMWQFAQRHADWDKVDAKDLWSYARNFVRGRQPATLNSDLSRLRMFLEFVQMKGCCSSRLALAVPRYACHGQANRREVLSDAQRHQLLACFDRSSFEGSRDYTMTLCMVDLGLRPVEVVRLCIDDFDFHRRALAIPPTKTDRGRQLPLPAQIVSALRAYLHHRPSSTPLAQLFLKMSAAGAYSILDTRAIYRIVTSAYRRCGFPNSLAGGYHLRHTFATRLYNNGISIKQIADMMGHRHLQTTTDYTRTDINSLRALTLPWPI